MSNRKLIVGLTVGAALGAAAATGLHAAAEPQPKAYMVAQIDIRDSEAYARDYVPNLAAALAPFGGRYLARGGKVVPLEGAAPRSRVAILEFPSLAAAQGFHGSPAYSALAKIRRQHSTADAFAIEGVAPQP